MRLVGLLTAVFLVCASSLLAEEGGYRDYGEDDEVEAFIKRQNEVDAAKMLEQAKQYRAVGTSKTIRSSKFILEEIIRRYPETPEAIEAREILKTFTPPMNPRYVPKVFRQPYNEEQWKLRDAPRNNVPELHGLNSC